MAGLVAIHQPNFFPWLGYFDKIRKADAFVFLDRVDYPRAGSGSMGSWCNRVRLAIQGQPQWVSCPVLRMPLGSPIAQARIDGRQPWQTKLLKTLEANYRKAPQYKPALDFLEPLIRSAEINLADFNIAAIRAIADRLGLSTRFARQSELACSGSATDLLVSIVTAAGGDAYLAGGGATGYQLDHVFGENGQTLVPQNFIPAPYGDGARFLPGLSVIDYLMWDGRPLHDAFPERAHV